MDTLSLVIAAILIVLLSIWFFYPKNVKKSPPGPTGWPLVGYLPYMTGKVCEVFQNLAKEYGPIYKIRLGSRNLLILCDYNSMKTAFNDDAFMGRPFDLPFDLSETTKKTGAFFDVKWKEQRKFALHTLRNLGYGKTRMERQIEEEIVEVLEGLEKTKGKGVIMSKFLATSTSNNVASFVFGKRFGHDDPRRAKLNKLLDNIGLLTGSLGWQLFFPWIGGFFRYLNLGKNATLKNDLIAVKDFIREEMKEHEATLDPNNIRDLMDAYILEIHKNAGNPHSTFQRDVLVDMSQSFFGAGSETVQHSVTWLALIVADNPEVQKKIHRELDEVIGKNRLPTYQDRLNLPFTEACIMETMRWRTIVPVNLMRRTLKDTELNGYFIPKNTDVLPISYCVDHDEELWGKDVNEYKPERFLSPDGKRLVKPEYYMPFSIGKRSCPGKTLAEIEVFLYCTAILQKFKLSFPPGKKANFEGILGVTLRPQEQEICLELR